MAPGNESRRRLVGFADEVRGARPAPELLTTLVGRTEEVTRVVDLLVLEPRTRLLTLTGPGGVGKTRLALEVARQATASFPSGVRFVPLGHQRDPDLVPQLVGKAFGAHGENEDRLVGALATAAHDGALLVLDNFEQVSGATPFVATLLAAAPGLAVLVTSREPLSLSGERQYRVRPLSPADALTLFVDRARAISPDFELTEANEPAIAAICARLEGLPLALELAAARVRLLSPQAIVDRLEQPLELLTGGPRDLPARQRTLRDTISWSYDLLPPQEQRLFARLAAFAGCSRLEAAESLAAVGHDGAGGVLDGLVGLVDRNLLRRVHYSNGEVRLAMLDTVREFALERLRESGEEDEIRAAHADLYADLVERARARWGTAEEEHWFDLLEMDNKNVRVALRWCLDAGNAEMALRLAQGLEPFWKARGHAVEGARLLAEARTAAGLECQDSSGLSGREVEILRLLAVGLSNSRIAERLVVSVRTVHAHVRSIYRKLGVSSRAEATRYALEHRLV